ncbi:MAG TPA: M24 family metallopeptidase [Herpetosiphonaceae bacterium]|nr:M24 family metallopeptidase [Herpetosiphonaceae bacterium]
MNEIETKLGLIRQLLLSNGLAAVRLRGVDWFAWATGGGSSVIILTDEAGVAEVLVTAHAALILTDTIEEDRLRAEEVPAEYAVWAAPWSETQARDSHVRELAGAGLIASDRPATGERELPAALVAAKRRLLPEEIERYRRLGAQTSSAVTEVMTAARPDWTERDLAGAAAEALWARGIDPALTLTGGERRLPLYGHITPTAERLGGRAMLVVCARGHGLYANMTRFVQFRAPSAEERELSAAVARIESAAWAASRVGAALGDTYAEIERAYAAAGWPDATRRLHQGGTTGYRSREVVARPGADTRIEANTALAWNPSLPGVKIEDTILVGERGLEILTADPVWPTEQIDGRARPLALEAF